MEKQLHFKDDSVTPDSIIQKENFTNKININNVSRWRSSKAGASADIQAWLLKNQ